MAFYPPLEIAKQITLTANIQLDYPYSADTNNVTIADMMDVSATLPNLNIILPNATLTGPGFALSFNNVGVQDFNVVLNDGITLLKLVTPGKIVTVYLYDSTTTNGIWRIIPFGGGTNGISSLNITSSDDSIDVTNSAITPPGGTVDLTLPVVNSSIVALNNYIPGIVVINQANTTSPWNVVQLVGGNNIDISNPDGSTGNPIINVSTTITIAELIAGTVIVNNNLISSTDDNAPLSIVSGANSLINLNSVLITPDGDLTANSLIVEGSFIAPNTAKAWCRFSNTSGQLATLAAYNVTDITYNSATFQYTIVFTTAMTNTNYLVNISCSNNNSTPPLQTRIGYDIVRELTFVTIVLTDSAGEILEDFPEGVSVMIFS